ncbi:MAG: hypothetical protein JWN04_2393 [Myxococcaceae bacterium]|nr:hypothetical protein [Myxococcaceae bacterium]
MKIHHLSCGTMCPLAGRWIEGAGSVFSRGHRICHCLLVETDSGLVLIETGLGKRDLEHPRKRLGSSFLGLTLPRLDPAETAEAQIRRLGFTQRDVRHIILTHGHCDHAGGIADFPDAQVHVTSDEYAAMTTPANMRERHAYRPAQWDHAPNWVRHTTSGDSWRGFSAIRAVPALGSEFLLLPLPGHTRGHAAVVVQHGERVLVHAGDLYMHRDELNTAQAKAPAALCMFQRMVDSDGAVRRDNLERLRQLRSESGVEVFCAHDAVEFEAAAARTKLLHAPRCTAGASQQHVE